MEVLAHDPAVGGTDIAETRCLWLVWQRLRVVFSGASVTNPEDMTDQEFCEMVDEISVAIAGQSSTFSFCCTEPNGNKPEAAGSSSAQDAQPIGQFHKQAGFLFAKKSKKLGAILAKLRDEKGIYCKSFAVSGGVYSFWNKFSYCWCQSAQKAQAVTIWYSDLDMVPSRLQPRP